MARLVSLAAARAQPLRPALRRSVLGVPLRRIGLLALAGLAALVAAYAVARETPLFAVGELEITGAPAEVRSEVKAALEGLAGTSLVKVDASEIESTLRGLPSVSDARVDRSFPHALRVAVVPEEPLALVWGGRVAWLVSRGGRAIRLVQPGARPPLPRIKTSSATMLSPGEQVVDRQAQAALGALAVVPREFPVRIRAARTGEAGLTFLLGSEIELRLGTADGLEDKFAAAAAVFAALSGTERRELAYLDVSLPQRPVGMNKSQV